MKIKTYKLKPIHERIKDFVEVDEVTSCWNWTGNISRDGYGRIRVGRTVDGSRRTEWAHRAAYCAFVGPILDGYVVRHMCNNRSCVNPHHLLVGSHKDNGEDRVCLSDEKIKELREKYATGNYTYHSLHKLFGVSVSSVGKFIRNERRTEV